MIETDVNRDEKKSMNSTQSSSNEIDLFRGIRILWGHRLRIFAYTFGVAVIAAIISLLMPKTFQATVVLMPPVESQGSSLLSSLANLPIGGMGLESGDDTMSLIAILKSRTVMEAVVSKFDLINEFDELNMEEAVRTLRNNVSYTVEEEGTIQISVTYGTAWFHPDDQEEYARHRCSEMADYFVTQLEIVNTGLKTQKASFERQFIEGRYYKNIEDLKAAEDSLKIFQEKNNMIALPEQTKAAIEIAAEMKGRVLANEVQLSVLRTTLNSENPELVRLQMEIDGLNNQLLGMDFDKSAIESNDIRLFPKFSNVPELGVQLMRLTRNVEIQNALFSFLIQQYEEAKIQEAKDTPSVQVLDRAQIPIRKHTPKRMLIVFFSALLTFMIHASTILAGSEKRAI
ncbi:MAG: hypothetical protein HQ507_07555 [Candidatus Marinimicrobia bacterium]|nr:hypothetical protein [Candidatus Neomarinimicrobiota bacterium]